MSGIFGQQRQYLRGQENFILHLQEEKLVVDYHSKSHLPLEYGRIDSSASRRIHVSITEHEHHKLIPS